jgi:hypothetical protein
LAIQYEVHPAFLVVMDGMPAGNRPGFGHIAFAVDDVAVLPTIRHVRTHITKQLRALEIPECAQL